VNCPRCGHELRPEARFCDQCAHPLAEGSAGSGRVEPRPVGYTPRHLADEVLTSRSAVEGERKEVTVLFADVKGSMQLAEQLDPEDWHRILDRFFRILTDGVHDYGGTVNQYLGDGIMALFGAPVAHEDHAERACHAALSLREALREYADELQASKGLPLAVRMGLNSGDVVVGRIGHDLRMDYTAQGHAVGLAARTEREAEPWSICVTERVARRVQDFFRLEPLGERRMAGVAEPLSLYTLEGPGPARTRLERSALRGFSRLVGRAGALDTLEKAWQQAQEGRGLAIGVEGEAGVGKSRLCAEFAGRCREAGARVFETHCPPHGRSLSFGAARDLVRSCLGIRPGIDPDEAQARLEADRAVAAEPDALPLLLAFLDLPDPDREASSGTSQRHLSDLLVRVLLAHLESAPTLLLVDDAHWVDADSEACLSALVAASASRAALVLANFRSEYAPPWRDLASYRQLGLRPLDPEASGVLLTELLGEDPSTAPLVARILEQASGNPFFLEEVVRSLAEEGTLQGERGAYRWTGRQGVQVPASVKQVLAARIDSLDESAKDLLQTASVIGKRFAKPLLVRVAGRGEDEVEAGLQRLETGEFIRRESLSRPDYVFEHPLTQEVAYGSLLRGRRTRLHGDTAAALETLGERLGEQAAWIAHHWEAAERPFESGRWQRRAALSVTNLVPRRSGSRLESGD
jgi:class 3 adenylate cyclase